MSAPQLHQTILPPSTHDKIFWCRGAFFFSRDLQPGNRFAILHTHLDNHISRPDWIQRHDLAEMRASLTTPLQNRGRNLIRGERRPHKQETSRFTFALPAFKPDFVFSFGFAKLTEKVKSKYRPVATISQIEIDAARSGRTCWGVPSPNPAHFALCAFFGCAAPYIAPKRS